MSMAEFRDNVVFKHISKVYPVGAHVECQYMLKAAHKSSSYDWIGLFRVGWSTNKDVIFYQWAPYPKDRREGEEIDGSVLFRASNLPSDDGEFYQYVYFNDRNKMCGASSPFQFRATRNDDIIEQDMEDEEMVFITTQQLVLEEKVKQLENEKEQLQQTWNEVDTDNVKLVQQVKHLETELADLKQQKETLAQQLVNMSSTIDEIRNEHTESMKVLQADIQLKEKELEACKEQLDSSQAEVSNRRSECLQVRMDLDQALGESETLKKELVLVKSHCARAEDERQQVTTQLDEMRERVAEGAGERETIDMLQAQLNSSQETVDGLEKHIMQQKNVIEASTVKQGHMEGEISTLTETLGDMSARIETVNTENHDVKSKLTKFETEIVELKLNGEELLKERNSLLSTVAKLDRDLKQAQEKAENMDVFDAQEDRYIALQTAYGIVKDELSRCESELSKLKRKETKFKQSDRQISELQAKLKLGEEEWKKVYQQKVEAERKLNRSTSSRSAAGSSDLTKDELQKMLEQLSKELEVRTQKKDKYKQKYLDEKQKVATTRDDHQREMDRMRKDLELARAQLDNQITSGYRVGKTDTPSKYPYDKVEPIVYPPIPPRDTDHATGGARPKMDGPVIVPRQTESDSRRGALEESLLEESTERAQPLKPLPPPIEPTRVSDQETYSHSPDFKQELRANLGIMECNQSSHSTSAVKNKQTPRRRPIQMEAAEEVMVVTKEESDDENEGPDRFHDASSDVPMSMVKCFMCDKVFHSGDSTADRTAHVNEHLAADQEAEDNYTCPICNKLFPKDSWTQSVFEMHVNSHFTITEYN